MDHAETRIKHLLRTKPALFGTRHKLLINRALTHAQNGKAGLVRRANIALLTEWAGVLKGADAARARSTLINLQAQS